jgi:16S rRNA processing protein RimM
MPSSSSKTEALRNLPEQVLVGIVLRPHGLRGAVVVEPWSDVPARFAAGSELALAPRAGGRRGVRVCESSPAAGGVRVRFEGVTTREEAESLRGARLEVPAAAVPPPPAGAYYLFELVGCRCVDRRRGELGVVVDVVEGGGGWLIVVEGEGGRRWPLPFVERYLARVDRGAGRIEWELPEGLIEACESRS